MEYYSSISNRSLPYYQTFALPNYHSINMLVIDSNLFPCWVILRLDIQRCGNRLFNS